MFLLLATLVLCAVAQEGFPPGGESKYPSYPDYTNNFSEGYTEVFTCPQISEGVSCMCTATQVDCSSLGISSVPNDLGSGVQRL